MSTWKVTVFAEMPNHGAEIEIQIISATSLEHAAKVAHEAMGKLGLLAEDCFSDDLPDCMPYTDD